MKQIPFYQAQVNKVDYILQKLYLKENMTLLDIGCGWGFLLIEAAKNIISKALASHSAQNNTKSVRSVLNKKGLQNDITVELLDYREI